jgi:cell division protein FtsB
VAVASQPARRAPARQPAARIRWDRVSRVAMLFALVVLLYLAISPLRALVTDVHLSAQRHAQLVTLRRQAAALAAAQRALAQPGTPQIEARNLGLVKKGERPYTVYGLPDN